MSHCFCFFLICFLYQFGSCLPSYLFVYICLSFLTSLLSCQIQGSKETSSTHISSSFSLIPFQKKKKKNLFTSVHTHCTRQGAIFFLSFYLSFFSFLTLSVYKPEFKAAAELTLSTSTEFPKTFTPISRSQRSRCEQPALKSSRQKTGN